ncbi:alanine--tRNA ligase, partial [Candidatus Calescamantes bacterium]|nr:alanine--tRNA ligase [Candidatus Calescamantes bacterium]
KKPVFRVAADHIRALTFLIGDGVLPSNAGRGYVVRKLLRRAASNLRKLSIEEPFLYKLVRTVEASMGDFYPEISEKTQLIENIILEEEERFIRLVKTGFTKYVQLKEKASANNDTLAGEELFELYDTYGFPIDLVKEMARDDGLKLDVKGFNEKMSVQREMARSSHKKQDLSALRNIPESVFTGYDALTGKGNILAILDLKYNPVDVIKEGEKGILILDSTPFYGESGGQAGDSGTFQLLNIKGVSSSQPVKGRIYDTQIFNDRHLHMIKVDEGNLSAATLVQLSVDGRKREQIRIHHTLTHLLHSALRDVLGEHCHQAGSFVEESGLRFDFTHFKKVTDEELTLIEKKVNQAIGKANEV